MTTKPGRRRPPRAAPRQELAALRARLAESEETLRAIRTGEVDAVVVAGRHGARVFTLVGVEHAYRVLIESMNEGALMLAPDKTILYANQCFAAMVGSSLEQVIGSSLRRFLSPGDRATLRRLMKRAGKSGAKIQLRLLASDGSSMPTQVSLRPLGASGLGRAAIGMVVTDMSEARRGEEALRSLSRRLVQAQEAERGRVAVELHDHVTQSLCAILFRYHALANVLSARDGPLKGEANRLRDMLGEAAEAVERISRDLRPGVLEDLGLVAVLRSASKGFTIRTSVPVKLSCARFAERLPGEIELTLYRIYQEALENVARHARAHHVTVRLRTSGAEVRLTVHDDGIGVDRAQLLAGRRGRIGLGLLGMRERATFVGGTFEVKSTRGSGTQIDVSIPLPVVGKALAS